MEKNIQLEAGQRVDAPPAESTPRDPAASRPLPEDAVIILPVRNTVIFPGLLAPLAIGRERSRAALAEAVRLERPIGLLLQTKSDIDEPGPDQLHWVGTLASVARYITAPDGSHHAIVKGVKRFRVLQFLDGYPFTVARIQEIADVGEGTPEVEGRAHQLKQRAAKVLEMLPQVPEELISAYNAVEGASALADFIAGMMDVTPEEKQNILEMFDLKARLDKLL